ncbi:MAG: hypothetical protein LBU32_07415 [Clostridiales bacterium]|jgi:hypothetical protein|nr:hypothetical protein [Clostridiales bacterium]
MNAASGIDGLRKHMYEERPDLENRGWKFMPIEEILAIPAFGRAIAEKLQIVLALYEFGANGNCGSALQKQLGFKRCGFEFHGSPLFFLRTAFFKGLEGTDAGGLLSGLHALQRNRLAEERQVVECVALPSLKSSFYFAPTQDFDAACVAGMEMWREQPCNLALAHAAVPKS